MSIQERLPDGNPKTAFGVLKPAFHFTPPIAEMVLGLAMRNGGEKYGPMNWRDDPVSSSTYYDAARRHLSAWLDGEDVDPQSGVHHLGHAMACCAILLDAAASGTLKDDRPTKGAFAVEAAKAVASFDKGCVTEPPAKAAPTRKFKKGDRIVYRENKTFGAQYGTVSGYEYSTICRDDLVKVDYDAGSAQMNGGYFERTLELVPFKVGDKVRFATGHTITVGRIKDGRLFGRCSCGVEDASIDAAITERVA